MGMGGRKAPLGDYEGNQHGHPGECYPLVHGKGGGEGVKGGSRGFEGYYGYGGGGGGVYGGVERDVYGVEGRENQHRSPSPPRQNMYYCDFDDCSHRYSSREQYEHHLETHGGRMYVCPSVECSNRYTSREQYERHLETHGGGGNPYVCPTVDCSYQSFDKTQFSRHLEVHDGRLGGAEQASNGNNNNNNNNNNSNVNGNVNGNNDDKGHKGGLGGHPCVAAGSSPYPSEYYHTHHYHSNAHVVRNGDQQHNDHRHCRFEYTPRSQSQPHGVHSRVSGRRGVDVKREGRGCVHGDYVEEEKEVRGEATNVNNNDVDEDDKEEEGGRLYLDALSKYALDGADDNDIGNAPSMHRGGARNGCDKGHHFNAESCEGENFESSSDECSDDHSEEEDKEDRVGKTATQSSTCASSDSEEEVLDRDKKAAPKTPKRRSKCRKKGVQSEERDRYACNFKGCKFTTSCLNDLRTHSRQHYYSKKSYLCTLCDFRGTNSSHLKYHMRTRHPDGK
eukprot:Nk52_evm11s913 gene=Nk52_evmTU11s913